MNVTILAEIFNVISKKMIENKDYLIYLDQQAGDGDLGLNMESGYSAAADFLKSCEISDIGLAINKTANAFNEAAPSSLGTITCFILKGMAKTLKGKNEASIEDVAQAILCGLQNVTEKTGSRKGEKTILDSFYPAAETLLECRNETVTIATTNAALAAKKGSEEAKNLKAVWGRAVYYGEKSIGKLDGGAEVGRIVFEAVAEWAAS